MNNSENHPLGAGFAKAMMFGGLLSIGLTASFGASAQPAEEGQREESSGSQIEEIVVTGQRYADILAIDAKRSERNILEAVSADDLGSLPDNNLGESLGRISGVSTVLDEGVGRYVTIRGVNPDLVGVSVDGANFASTARTWENAGRAANIEAISDDFISRIEVFKSVSADMDANSIGGTVNFVSRSAFDLRDGQTFFVSLDASVGENSSDDAPFSDAGTNSRLKFISQFLLGDDQQFGFTLSGNYKKEDKDVIKQGIHFWGGTGLLPSGNLAPDGLWDTLIHEDSEKTGFTAKFEFMPSDDMVASLSYNFFDEDQEWNNGAHQLFRSGSYDEAAGTFSGWAGIVSHKNSMFGTDGDNVAFNLDWGNSEDGLLELSANTSSSTSYLHEPRFEWVGNWGAIDGTYSSNGREYTFIVDDATGSLYDDTSTYFVNQIRETDNSAVTDVDSYSLDWTNPLVISGRDVVLKTGLTISDSQYTFRESFLRADRYGGADHFQQYITQYNYVPPSASNRLLFGNIPALAQDIRGQYGTLRDFALSEFTRIRADYDNGADIDTSETVKAAYLMGDVYVSEALSLRLGARYEGTEWDGRNRLNNAQDAAFVKHGGEYDSILPSASVIYDVTDSLRLRAAYSETLGRPGMEQLAAFSSDPNPTTGIFWASNPDLEPRQSKNVDLSVEYYLAGGRSMFALGYFNKQIDNEIFDQQIPYQYDNGTQVIPSFFIQPENAGSGSVSGVEASVVITSFTGFPDALAGLGLNANITIQDGELEILDDDGSVLRNLDRMPKAPELLYNLALTYDLGRFDSRLSYQYMGERTITLAGGAASSSDDLVRESTNRLDLHLGYDLTDNVSLYVDIWNLTEQSTQDRGDAFWDEETVYGRSSWAGAKARF